MRARKGTPAPTAPATAAAMGARGGSEGLAFLVLARGDCIGEVRLEVPVVDLLEPLAVAHDQCASLEEGPRSACGTAAPCKGFGEAVGTDREAAAAATSAAIGAVPGRSGREDVAFVLG